MYVVHMYIICCRFSSLFDQINFFLEENAIYLSALEKDHIFPLKNVCFKKFFFEFDFYIFFSFK